MVLRTIGLNSGGGERMRLIFDIIYIVDVVYRVPLRRALWDFRWPSPSFWIMGSTRTFLLALLLLRFSDGCCEPVSHVISLSFRQALGAPYAVV